MKFEVDNLLAKNLKKDKDLEKEETRFLNSLFDNLREDLRKVEKAKGKSKGR